MAKRVATSVLNHDNWDKEEKPEDSGTFRKADGIAMQSRVVRQAKRRSTSSPYNSLESPNKTAEPKNVFEGFTGFKMASNTAPINFNFSPVTSSSSDASLTLKESFVASSQSKFGNSKGSLGQLGAHKEGKDRNNADKYCNRPKEFYADLRAINESVCNWIQMHVKENSCCILTPVFKDYEKHLSKLEEKFGSAKNDTASVNKEEIDIDGTSSNNKEPTQTPFTFGVIGVSQNFSSSPLLSSSFPMMKKPEDKKGSTEPSKDSKNPLLGSFKPVLAPPIQVSDGSNGEEKNMPQVQFSFSSQKPFTFANVSKPEGSSEEKNSDNKDESDEPPKVEFKPVVENDAVYSARCKVFIKKGGSFQDHGVGTLFLKPVSNATKTQLIVRADTSLGNVLLNTLLFSSMPLQRMGNNNVMIVCIPTPDAEPPPVPILIRVKTAEDADNLLEKLKEHVK